MKRIVLLPLFALLSLSIWAQSLQPGFDALEYKQLLLISGRQGDTPWVNVKIPVPQLYKLTYRSAEVGLDNRWDLWEAPYKAPVFSIRGTTGEMTSWLANFYAAMIPASGSIKLSDSYIFDYKFAADSGALVHTGWTIGLAFLWSDIKAKIMDQYTKGQRNMLVMGHSQGGAIAFLLHSLLYYKQQSGEIPADITFKTYCSAAPKPGNLFYAYDFDFITRNGMAFRVVNSADWVPEMPFSIQTLKDVNKVNPFSDPNKQLKKMPWIQRVAVKHVYNDMNRAANKANKTFRKYLGGLTYRFVKKSLADFPKPNNAVSLNYTTAGHPVILWASPSYKEFAKTLPQHSFTHHFMQAYLFLVDEIYLNKK